MDRRAFARRLESAPLLFDGGMGTLLYDRGVFVNRCFDELNLTQPDLVRDGHAAFAAAGAEVVETNTYGAHRLKLAGYGLAEKTFDINRAGATIARAAAGDRALVAGSLGPARAPGTGEAPLARETVAAAYADQVAGLIAGGVDLLIVETQHDLGDAAAIVGEIRRRTSELPVVLQFAVSEQHTLPDGTTLDEIARRTADLPVDAVGLNCVLGPRDMLEAVQAFLPAARLPAAVQPNAGYPRAMDNRYIYLTNTEYLASHVRRYLSLGARIVGGCCGVTPEHVRGMRNALRTATPGRIDDAAAAVTVSGADAGPARAAGVDPVPTAAKSPFAAKLRNGPQLVCSVEVSPPKGGDPTAVLAKIRTLIAGGVDLINIPDGPRASARMSAAALAARVALDLNHETVLHVCARDRNLLGLQGDLLGMNALGIRNLVLITGDPPKMGDCPHATAVFDVDSIGLCRIAEKLNRGLDIGAKPLGAPVVLHYGVGCDPGALDLDREHRRLAEKLTAGAEFIMTQPVYDTDVLDTFLHRADLGEVPVLVGVLPLASSRNAEFLHNEVPGMRVPDAVRARMRAAGSGPAAQAEGVRIAQEAVWTAKDMKNVRGFYVMPPLGRYELALDVLAPLKEAGLWARTADCAAPGAG